jgi:hypothetical protein
LNAAKRIRIALDFEAMQNIADREDIDPACAVSEFPADVHSRLAGQK